MSDFFPLFSKDNDKTNTIGRPHPPRVSVPFTINNVIVTVWCGSGMNQSRARRVRDVCF